MRIDHIALAVPHLEGAASALLEEHGLASTPPSPQPEWGTANRIVPLGDAFLELIAVDHPAIAEKSSVGRRVARLAPATGLAFWAVRPEAIGPIATRLGLSVTEGERRRPDGTVYSWQVAGMDVASEEGLPFLIHWTWTGTLPHRLPVQHRVKPHGFAWVEVGDRDRLVDWLGPSHLPIRKVQDERVLVRCAIRTERGEVVLGT